MQNIKIHDSVYIILATLFCMIAILANIITVKLVPSPFFNEMPLPAGLMIYPLTFFISNLVTELFGTAKARFMVILSFAMACISYLIIAMTLALPSFDNHVQSSFESVFSLNGIMLFSSLTAYAVAQTIDIQLYASIKTWSNGKYLWLRVTSSLAIAQFIDAAIVCLGQLYFGMGLPLAIVIQIIIFSYFYKALIGLSITPLFYAAVAGVRRILQNMQYETR